MADSESTETDTPVEASDAAAATAVVDFFAKNDRETAAEKETGESSPSLIAAIRGRDNADQKQELLDEGVVDADGNAIEPEVKTDEAEVEVPANSKAAGETPAAEATLDPILIEAALEAGYTEAQIERLYKADAEIAETTFARLISNPGLPRTDPAASTAASDAAKNADIKLPDMLTDDGLKKLAESNGAEFADALKAVRDAIVAPMQAMQAQLATSHREAIANEANTVIADLAKANVAIYGDGTPGKTTIAQQAKRDSLAVTADQLIAGATAQGRKLSVTDALKRAHYIVGRDTIKVQARKEITDQVKRRSAAITNKPTKRAAPKANSGEQSESAAAEVVNNFWAERGS